MVRWGLVAAAMLGFALAFAAQSMGALALGLLVGTGALLGALFAFAAARMESVSQSQNSREVSMILEASKSKTGRRGDGSDASPTLVGSMTAGDGGGRPKSPAHDDRVADGPDCGSDGGGDGGGGGGD